MTESPGSVYLFTDAHQQLLAARLLTPGEAYGPGGTRTARELSLMFYKVFPGFPHLGEEAIRAGYLTGTRLLPAPVEVGEFLGLTGGLRFAHSVYGLDAASVAEVQAYFRSVA